MGLADSWRDMDEGSKKKVIGLGAVAVVLGLVLVWVYWPTVPAPLDPKIKAAADAMTKDPAASAPPAEGDYGPRGASRKSQPMNSK